MRTILLILSCGLLGSGFYLANVPQDREALWQWINITYINSNQLIQDNPNESISISTMVLSITFWVIYFGFYRRSGYTLETNSSKSIAKIEKKIDEWLTITEVIDNNDSPVITKSKARALKNQLVTDKSIIEGRQRYLPQEIEHSSQEVNRTTKDYINAQKYLEECKVKFDTANDKLLQLKQESDKNLQEIEDISAEIERLKPLV